ncbi:MAG: hypothetical protein Q8P18_29810 [Pseudomonadota bacterium]|nr:hypothetical protein [Pseudomonadota bacterium]
MPSLSAVSAVLLLALVGVEGAFLVQRGHPGVVVTPSDTRVPAAAPSAGARRDFGDIEPAFLGHMTADDVARGVYALAAQQGALALTDAQRVTMTPLLREGADLRARLGVLRTERRAAREAWMVHGTGLVSALGPDRVAQAAARSAVPTGPR